MRSRILSIVLGGLVGISLTWVAITLLGLLVVTSSKYRFWGQSIYLITIIEYVLAFFPLSVAVGALLALRYPQHALLANIGGAVGALAPLLSGVNWLNFSSHEAATAAATFFLLPSSLIIGGIVLGAVFAKSRSNEVTRA